MKKKCSYDIEKHKNGQLGTKLGTTFDDLA